MTIFHDGEVLLTDFGAVADGVSDVYPAFVAAKDYIIANGRNLGTSGKWRSCPTLRLPFGKMYSSQTWHLKGGTMNIKGHGMAVPGSAEGATSIYFEPQVPGIVGHHWDTDGLSEDAVPPPYTAQAGHSLLEDFQIRSLGGEGDFDGIWLRVGMILNRVTVTNFGRDNFHIVGSENRAGGWPEGGPNHWRMYDCEGGTAKRHNLYIGGYDANQGICIGGNFTGATGCGIKDESFLGNYFEGCHTSDNDERPYDLGSNPNARSALVACYSEGNQYPSSVINKSFALGGEHGAGFTADSNFWKANSGSFWAQGKLEANSNGRTHSWGGDSIWSINDAAAWGSASKNFRAWVKANDVAVEWQNSPTIMQFTGPLTDKMFGRGVAQPHSLWLRQLFLGHEHVNSARQMTMGNTVPTTGTWAKGDRVFNINPVAGGKEGWVCVTAGTPGTWKEFGAIDL